MITLICGHSRAGKTTYSKKYDGLCPVIHLDEIGTHTKVNKIVHTITDNIVVEGIYYIAEERKKLLESYSGEGSRCIFIDTPIEVRRERTNHNIMDFPFPCPAYDEGWDEIIIIKG